MTLIFSNHRFQYEVERLFRNFINEPGIKLSTDKADAQGDFCLTEKVEYPGGAELSVDLVREGKRFCMSRSIPGGMPEKEQERELCILLYKALREYTGRDLPWGILTGVRPVKVLSKLTDAQAKEVYNLNFQQIKEMQAMREKMQEARKAEAEKMKSILTTEQFVQWSQMQAPRPGERGPQMMHKGDRRGGGKECCDKPCPKKDKKGKE